MPKQPVHLESAKAHLAEHGETRAKELADAIGVAPGTLQAALKCAVRDGFVVKRMEGRAVFFSLPDGEPQPADGDAPDFNAALWADGDLVLVGVTLNDDGHSVTLGPDKVRTLCRLLHGQGPEE